MKKGAYCPSFLDLDIEIQSYDLLFNYPLIVSPANTVPKAPTITLAGSCS